MPTKHGPYDAITDDLYDACIPLHNEVAFQHGIHFESKVSRRHVFQFPLCTKNLCQYTISVTITCRHLLKISCWKKFFLYSTVWETSSKFHKSIFHFHKSTFHSLLPPQINKIWQQFNFFVCRVFCVVHVNYIYLFMFSKTLSLPVYNLKVRSNSLKLVKPVC